MILWVGVGDEIFKISMSFVGSSLFEKLSDLRNIFDEIG